MRLRNEKLLKIDDTMKKWFLMVALMLSVVGMEAQQVSEIYEELPNPVTTDLSKWTKVTNPIVAWGSTDVRYNKELPAQVTPGVPMNLIGWMGEKLSAQFVISTNRDMKNVSVEVSDIVAKNYKISKWNTERGFVRYVMTDELNKDGKGACGYRKKEDFDSTLVADVIDHITPTLNIKANTTQPVWVSVKVPAENIIKGMYRGTVTVKEDGKVVAQLPLTVTVKNRVLPPSSEWAFHLDLWQNPYAVARYYNVEPFSQEHFDLMRPIMKRYADAGGKVITTSIMHKPWNGQTYDPFESMVTWMKKADGTWYFDYTVFDKWVEFMMSCGVKKEINCYSMVPWRLSFQYFDQASNSFKYFQGKPGQPEYEEFWMRMLKSFAQHLKEKGWFEITHIAMDERGLKDMLATIDVVYKADPDFKLSLAGTYHKELLEHLDDYCITLAEKFTPEEIAQRKADGRVTTYYTCCTEPRPNTFTFSPLAEAEWLGWWAAKINVDGYLRWALNSWVKDPLLDSRFTAWAAGDTYILYPGGRTCTRFERLIEGIQAYEKIRILRNEKDKRGRSKNYGKQIDKILEPFNEFNLVEVPAEKVVNKAKAALNKF